MCLVSPPVFEVLHAAQAAEPAVDHDGHSGAERFTFLHAAQRQTNDMLQFMAHTKEPVFRSIAGI